MTAEAKILQKLQGIEAILINSSKEWLTLSELATYLGISKGKVYELTQAKTFSLYKPGGKITYVKRAEVDEWIESHRVATAKHVVDGKANDYLMKKLQG
jgi:prophage regulatory protein